MEVLIDAESPDFKITCMTDGRTDDGQNQLLNPARAYAARGNKDANSSVESGNATLCDMAELAVGGRASREIPLEFTNNSVGLPKKESWLA